jgi:hypothetical protein
VNIHDDLDKEDSMVAHIIVMQTVMADSDAAAVRDGIDQIVLLMADDAVTADHKVEIQATAQWEVHDLQ